MSATSVITSRALEVFTEDDEFFLPNRILDAVWQDAVLNTKDLTMLLSDAINGDSGVSDSLVAFVELPSQSNIVTLRGRLKTLFRNYALFLAEDTESDAREALQDTLRDRGAEV